jgi:NTP pyrophosphatase (non-canonical NTP hydrolase)
MSIQPVAMDKTINVLTNYCYLVSKEAGWWVDSDGNPLQDNPYMLGQRLLLIHSEISEATEGDRKDCMDKHLTHRKMVEVELADAFIRLCDLAGAYNMDLGGAVVEKISYNLSRQDHSKEAREGTNGKKY